jgi:hypothetical protein
MAFQKPTRKSISRLFVPWAKFISPEAPTRKMDLVPFLIRAMSSEDVVRRLYDELGEVPKAAIQEAVANPSAEIRIVRFQAKYGHAPNEGSRATPTALNLFFPVGWYIPPDLRAILESFVPAPRAVSIDSSDNVPATVPEQISAWRIRTGAKPQSIPLRQRSTAPAALREFATVLRLFESGKVKVSDKTRKPSQAAVDCIGPFLVDGDLFLLRPADTKDGTDVDVLPPAGLAGERIDVAIALDRGGSIPDDGNGPNPLGQRGDVPALRLGAVGINLSAQNVNDHSGRDDRHCLTLDGCV